MATDLCCSHDRIVGARFAGNGVAKPVKGVVTLVLNTQYTGHAHSWGGEEIRRCQAGNAVLVSKRRGSNFLQEEIGWNGGLRLLPEETAGASLAFAAVAAFMLSSIQGTLLHPPPSWWVLPMQGTLPQLLLMLNGQ